MAQPPGPMVRPSIGEQLDARLRADADALARLTERLSTIASAMASQAVEISDLSRAVAHLQRAVGRHP